MNPSHFKILMKEGQDIENGQRKGHKNIYPLHPLLQYC